MIISEKNESIVNEFSKHGELSNNIKLMHYGHLLLEAMERLDCTLLQLLNAINNASQEQILDHNFGRAIL